MKNILFFGGSSLLATIWANYWRQKFNIYKTIHNQRLDDEEENIIKIDEISEFTIKSILKRYKIDLLINCVGLTNVEECEHSPKKANYLNAQVPLILAKTCFTYNIKFIHISTDHLFDGGKELRSELDEPHPLNIYAKSKLKGDQNVTVYNPDSLIIRTNFFGPGPSYRPSFSDIIINTIKRKKKIELFDDVYFTPVHVNEIARIIIKLLENKGNGIYNISSNERITKYEFGLIIARNMNLSMGLIKKGLIEERKDLVVRPKDMSLSNTKIKEKLNLEITSIKDQIALLSV